MAAPILPYNNNKVWPNVWWFYDILDVFSKNYKRTRTFAIVLLLRIILHVLSEPNEYNFNYRRRGVFLIFNNKHFNDSLGKMEREGTDVDASNAYP